MPAKFISIFTAAWLQPSPLGVLLVLDHAPGVMGKLLSGLGLRPQAQTAWYIMPFASKRLVPPST